MYSHIPSFFGFPSHLGHDRQLTRDPCIIHQFLISYLFYIWKLEVLVTSHIQLFATPWTVVHQVPLPMGFSGKNTKGSCHSLLQGILPTRGLTLGLLHCRQILYCLSHHGGSVYMLIQISQFIPPLASTCSFSISASLFLLCK